jgi:hypothetical protein
MPRPRGSREPDIALWRAEGVCTWDRIEGSEFFSV